MTHQGVVVDGHDQQHEREAQNDPQDLPPVVIRIGPSLSGTVDGRDAQAGGQGEPQDQQPVNSEPKAPVEYHRLRASSVLRNRLGKTSEGWEGRGGPPARRAPPESPGPRPGFSRGG